MQDFPLDKYMKKAGRGLKIQKLYQNAGENEKLSQKKSKKTKKGFGKGFTPGLKKPVPVFTFEMS